MSDNKFNIGDLVEHRASGMLGVVIGITPPLPYGEFCYDIETNYGTIVQYVLEVVLSPARGEFEQA